MTLIFAVILVALVFEYINGFHDAANSIATVVSTRVLSPKLAVVWAAFFNFLAAFFLGTAVAKTIGGEIANPALVTQSVLAAALLGAIAWNLLTWYYGIPSSFSHALIGGYAGAAMARVELADSRFRFNPLVDWTEADLTHYIEEHGLPKHPLVNDGYPSIGCLPCTRRLAAGEGYRDGRWAGFDKDECGIHAGIDGEGI